MGKKNKNPVDANIWSDGQKIVGFSFSDGYKYVGKDADKKFQEHAATVEVAGTLTPYSVEKK